MTTATVAAAASAVCAAVAAAQLEPLGRTPLGPALTGAGTASVASAALRRAPSAGHLVAAVLGASIGAVVGGAVAALVLGAVGAGASMARERQALDRATRLRERAAPALARAVADAVRGGASIRSAITTASTDHAVPPALRREMADLTASLTFGAPLLDALDALGRAGGPTLRLLCGTIAMHLESGGALAAELDRLATAGEAATRIDEDRRSATAQARATVRVVAALPVLALLAAETATGSFVRTVAGNPIALALLLLGFALEGAAIVAARAIVGRVR